MNSASQSERSAAVSGVYLRMWIINLRNMLHFFRKTNERMRDELQKLVERLGRHDLGCLG